VQIASNVNATIIPLDAAPDGYAEFDSGVAKWSCSTRTA
jgi:glutathione-independent formaldehyde dehydrogenase